MGEYRSLLLLVYALHAMQPRRWATYAGLQQALAISTRRQVRRLVRRAQERGYVRVTMARITPHSPRRALVRAAPASRLLVSSIFREEVAHGA